METDVHTGRAVERYKRNRVRTGVVLTKTEGYLGLPEAGRVQKPSFFSRHLRDREPVPARGG